MPRYGGPISVTFTPESSCDGYNSCIPSEGGGRNKRTNNVFDRKKNKHARPQIIRWICDILEKHHCDGMAGCSLPLLSLTPLYLSWSTRWFTHLTVLEGCMCVCVSHATVMERSSFLSSFLENESFSVNTYLKSFLLQRRLQRCRRLLLLLFLGEGPISTVILPPKPSLTSSILFLQFLLWSGVGRGNKKESRWYNQYLSPARKINYKVHGQEM